MHCCFRRSYAGTVRVLLVVAVVLPLILLSQQICSAAAAVSGASPSPFSPAVDKLLSLAARLRGLDEIKLAEIVDDQAWNLQVKESPALTADDQDKLIAYLWKQVSGSYLTTENVSGVTQSKITLNIPANQVAFPFTPQPKYSANARAAKAAGPDVNAFMAVENMHNGIGAWGDSKYYPDNANPPINKATKKRQILRRLGANFNFGAMMRGAGYTLNYTLYIAQLIVDWKHPIVEQYAIAGGWTWEEEKEPALDYKGHSVFTFNLTNVPNGDLPF